MSLGIREMYIWPEIITKEKEGEKGNRKALCFSRKRNNNSTSY